MIGQVNLDAAARVGLNRLFTEGPMACGLGLQPARTHSASFLPKMKPIPFPSRYLLDTSVYPR